MVPLHLSRSGLVEFGSLPQAPGRGELIVLVGVRGGLWVAVRKVSRTHSPMRTPLLLRHVESGQPLPLSLSTAGQSVEGDPGIFHRRVTTYDAVTRHSQLLEMSRRWKPLAVDYQDASFTPGSGCDKENWNVNARF